MHMLEPKEIAKRSKEKSSKKRGGQAMLAVLCVLMALAGLGGYWYLKMRPHSEVSQTIVQPAPRAAPKSKASSKVTEPKTRLKTFTGPQFKDLYHSISYPNTEPFTNPPEITGNVVADDHIRTLAEKRGFVLTSIPVAPIVKTGEKLISADGDDLLQPLAQKSWLQLKAAANTAGVKMTLISAYRSPKWQRDLFMQRLLTNGGNVQKIADGLGDVAVNDTLSMTAVPGYSRHHTGYTVDLYCEDGVAFASSTCNTWISQNNFEQAKKAGWIPSYPPGADVQGPEPEPWEYV